MEERKFEDSIRLEFGNTVKIKNSNQEPTIRKTSVLGPDHGVVGRISQDVYHPRA